MKGKMFLTAMMGIALATVFNGNQSYPPRNIPSNKPKQTDEERNQALLKAKLKRDRKALKRGKKQ